MTKRRNCTEFKTSVPSESGAVVGMCEYKGVIMLACQHHIYQLCESDMIFKKIEFQHDPKCVDPWHVMEPVITSDQVELKNS